MHPFFPPTLYLLSLEGDGPVPYDLAALYRKHSDLNRYTIQTAQGPLPLTADIGGPRWQVPYGDIRLSYGRDWPAKHLKALRSAYRGAPFFEHYEQELAGILTYRYDFLYQLSIAALSFCLEKAGRRNLVKIVTLGGNERERYARSRHIITADMPDVSTLPPGLAYRSVFGADFDRNISVLDALFCVGPHRLRDAFRRYDEGSAEAPASA